jgi:hypothetical protein
MLPELELPSKRDLPPMIQRAKREALLRQLETKRPRLRTGRVAVAFVIATLLAAGPAFALRGHIVDLFSSASQSHPQGAWTLPPRSAAPPALVQQMGARANVAASSLRQVVAAGAGKDRLALVVGVGADGRLWVGEGGESWAAEFVPLERRVARSDAIVEFLRYGGSSSDATDHAELVGFVRSDVRQVVVTRVDGTQVAVPLNEWRGFAYSSDVPTALPIKIQAFGTNDRLVDEKAVDTAPAP